MRFVHVNLCRFTVAWSSSQWISSSYSCVSTTRIHYWAPFRCLSDRDCSGLNVRSCRTTSHLSASLHNGLMPRRCPGLECWTSSRDGMSIHHL